VVAAALATQVSCAGPPAIIADPFAPLKVDRKSNIAYVTGSGADLLMHRLDVYRPRGDAKNAPVVLFVHGGSWKVGDKATDQNVFNTLAEKGIVCVSINYRLSPLFKHPTQARDVARAFDWVKKHIAEYGGNPDDVFLCGHSAGGHLVALLATNDKYLREVGRRPGEIRGVICFSGVYRVGWFGPFYGGVFDADDVDDASPIEHVGDSQPPFLLFYTDADYPTLGNQAQDFFAKLQEHRSPAKLQQVVFRSHTLELWFIGTPGDPATKATLEFIREYSKKK
jgi:acetyl esterase/lipase